MVETRLSTRLIDKHVTVYNGKVVQGTDKAILAVCNHAVCKHIKKALVS